MRIETDDWMTMPDASKASGINQRTIYRYAERLGIIHEFFGVKVIRKADVQKMLDNPPRVGNPRWMDSYEEAAVAAVRAVESRMKRVAASGPTKAEIRRNKTLSAGKHMPNSRASS